MSSSQIYVPLSSYTTPSSTPPVHHRARRPPTLVIATFNVRGISSALKKSELVRDLHSYGVSVAGIQETKSPPMDMTICHESSKYRLITFDTTNRHAGIGFAYDTRIEEFVEGWKLISERVAVLDLTFPTQGKSNLGWKARFVVAYAPTLAKSTEDPLVA